MRRLFEQLQLYVACIDEDLDIQPSGCTAELKKLQDMKRLLNLMQSPNAVLQATGRSFFGYVFSLIQYVLLNMTIFISLQVNYELQAFAGI